MYVCLDASVSGCMDGWMDGWMDPCMHVCRCACIQVCMYAGMHVCMYSYVLTKRYPTKKKKKRKNDGKTKDNISFERNGPFTNDRNNSKEKRLSKPTRLSVLR